MHIHLLSCSPTREPYWLTAEQEYIKRCKGWKILISEPRIPALANKKISLCQVLQELPKRCFCFVVDERGKALSSTELAEQIKNLGLGGTSALAFVLGPAEGFAIDVPKTVRAPFYLSLSSFVLPHQLARVVIIEQLYRAWSILNKRAYHRG